jgi:uncharacterized protein
VSEPLAIEALPFPLAWDPEPVESRTGPDSLHAVAAGDTDLFVDPGTRAEHLNAPRLLGHVEGDCTLAARVNVDFQATFDAGALLLWAGEPTWAKICFELSPGGDPTVVSVVTRGVSDDCNSFAVEGDGVWLRLARLGPAAAFHASPDGRRWELIRYFALAADEEPLLGFLVQSPRGEGCAAHFERISFAAGRLADIRSGE